MEYVQMTLNDWLDMKHKLKMELQGVKQSFVRIGYVLRKIEDQKLYEQDGYKSIAEFAKEEYGLEASTVSRFMSINREYSIDGYSEHLREEYLDMTRSQLEEMLKLPDKDREMVRPETPRADIRELKHFNKTEPASGVADDIKELIVRFFEGNKEILNELFAEERTVEKNVEIVNPGGTKTFKKGMFFLMMYENEIKIKKFGSDPQTMSWKEFFDTTKEIFGEAADGTRTWKNYFGGTEDGGKVEVSEGIAGSSCEDAGRGVQGASGRADSAEKSGERHGGNLEENGRIETGRGKAEKSGSSPTDEPVAASEEMPEKEEIAPAQNVAPHSVNTKCEEVSEEEKDEQIPGQMEVSDYPELMPDSMNPPVEGPYMTRKEYLDTLTEHGMAEYMARSMREKKGPSNSLFPSAWEEWLTVKVDEKGRFAD